MRYDIDPEFSVCDFHDEVTPINDWGEPSKWGHFCPMCRRRVIHYYKCPGCGEEKPEHEFLIDDIDLCKSCFAEELKELSIMFDKPRKRQIYDYLEGCS